MKLPRRVTETDLTLRVNAADNSKIIFYSPRERVKGEVPPPATEPLAPADVGSADELYTTGLHLEQYRHATRSPVLYWCEALRRDPLDSRCNNAMGLWHLRRGEFAEGETHFRKAIECLTRRNANPRDGEAYYNLGLCLRFQSDGGPRLWSKTQPQRVIMSGRMGSDGSAAAGASHTTALQCFEEVYAALYKATWNQAWAGASYHALAEMDCVKTNWATALEHLNRSLRFNTDNLRARNLKVLVLRKLGEISQAGSLLRETLAIDRLDWWARHLDYEEPSCDLQVQLDLAHDYARAGFLDEAITLLKSAKATPGDLPDQSWGAAPLVEYALGWLHEKYGDRKAALKHFRQASVLPPDYCFPSRLEDISILESAMRANPADARLLYERDQLWKRLGEKPGTRLRELEKHLDLVRQRDDLSVELCALYNQTGQHVKAMQLVASRQFQPWEGGEGGPLGQHVRAQLALGWATLAHRDFANARAHFEHALTSPRNLSEAKHLLANQSDIHYWLGCACAGLADHKSARHHWLAAAHFKGDFQEMSVRTFSAMTYYSALAWEKLGSRAKAKKLFYDLLAYAQELQKTPARIDYFATSLPTMLLFEDDLQHRQETMALFLQAQAHLGLGQKAKGQALLKAVLKREPNHALARDLSQVLDKAKGTNRRLSKAIKRSGRGADRNGRESGNGAPGPFIKNPQYEYGRTNEFPANIGGAFPLAAAPNGNV